MKTKRRPASRKSRNRVKKTKRLSEMQPDSNSDHLKVLLDPEHDQLAEERETHDHDYVAYNFFSAADGGATTLNGLLDNTASNSSHAITSSSFRPDDSYAYGVHDEESGAAFVRNAMRNRERDSSEEEKWVCYSEVVERKVIKEEEVSSSTNAIDDEWVGIQRLSLKLDYQEILNAWSDKGPLYIHAPDSHSQVVPDINEDYFSHVASNNGMSWGCNVGLWTVPEMIKDDGNNNNNNSEMMMMRKDESKMVQREASVLRYKEKRQNRLFSKKIRYQVRKLNAEKRPRLKGRFVKRS